MAEKRNNDETATQYVDASEQTKKQTSRICVLHFCLVFQEPTMFVLSFTDVIATCEADMKLGVVISSEDETDPPVKIDAYWLNAYTVYFLAPRKYTTVNELTDPLHARLAVR